MGENGWERLGRKGDVWEWGEDQEWAEIGGMGWAYRQQKPPCIHIQTFRGLSQLPWNLNTAPSLYGMYWSDQVMACYFLKAFLFFVVSTAMTRGNDQNIFYFFFLEKA